ncbi:unnamed protein product [Rotaria sp. Silwood2]|nr:unnamed protein product [Rotaria sp. Silwood2]
MASASQTNPDDFLIRFEGQFDGGFYKITREGSSAILSVTLIDNGSIMVKPDILVARSGNIAFKRAFRFKLRKLLNDDPFFEYFCVGKGEILLAPSIWGDIVPIHLDGDTKWTVGRNGHLAMTYGIVKETMSHPICREIMMNEPVFVYRFSGPGVVFIPSLGAVQQRTLNKGEKWFVNLAALVAWNCYYEMKGDEQDLSIVCCFEGPGTVITQAQNHNALPSWIIRRGEN